MVETLNLGLIGCGGISHAHRQAMKQQSDARFVAFCDTDASKSQQAASEDGGTAYTDVQQMLDEQDLDGVVICTPPTVRTELITAAASRGLPIFCEKPPAMTLETARCIEQVIAQNNVLVSVGFLFRYFPVVDRLRELVGDRKVAYARSRYLGNVANNPEFQSKPWYFLKEQSGGPVVDQAIHVLDLIRFLFGDADVVAAQGGFRTRPHDPNNNTAEDTVTLQFVTQTGVLVSHSHCWGHCRWLDELEVTGADFSFLVDLNNQRLTGVNGDQDIYFEQPVNGYFYEQRAWLNAIRTGDRSSIRSSYADAAKSLALCLAVNRSIESGNPKRVEAL
jgi:predicted dehydrogenase